MLYELAHGRISQTEYDEGQKEAKRLLMEAFEKRKDF